MIDLSHWVFFLTASLLIAVLPGPGVANIVGYALNSGQRTAFAAITGAVTGNLIAMLLSLAGMGALLEASPRVYKLAEFAGAAYLVALGLIGISRSRPPATADAGVRAAIPSRVAFVGSIAVSALNPKSIVFFVAFVPQFIASDGSYLAQSLVLAVTFASVVAITDTLYALLALRVAGFLRSPVTAVWVRRAGGLVLLCTGLAAAFVGWRNGW